MQLFMSSTLRSVYEAKVSQRRLHMSAFNPVSAIALVGETVLEIVMQTCPECKGEGKYYSRRFVTRTTGCDYEEGEQTCFTCDGSGSITDAHATRIEQGRMLRENRKARGLSLRQEAQRLGMKPSELNDLERGRK